MVARCCSRGHPYGKPTGGSETSLPRSRERMCQVLSAHHFGADRLTLVFAGDFEPAGAQGVERAPPSVPGVPAGAPLPPLAAAACACSGRRVLLIDAPGSEQTYFWIGNVGVARSYPQRAALELTNTAFGGSFGSMLVQALRVQIGLTYSAHARFHRGSVPGEFAISSFTQTSSTARAIETALGTLSTLKHAGHRRRCHRIGTQLYPGPVSARL